MYQKRFPVGIVAASMIAIAPAVHADGPIPADQMMSKINQAIKAKFDAGGFSDFRATKFKIISAKVNGAKPAPNAYWIDDDSVPYLNCSSAESTVSMSVSGTDRSEVTLSKVETNTVSVSVEVGAQFSGVSASVASGFEHSVESGVSTTQGTEITIEKSQSGVLKPNSGVWASPVSSRYEYSNSPYEVTVEVSGMQGKMKLGGQWLPLVLPDSKPMQFTVMGTVSGVFPILCSNRTKPIAA